MCTRALLSNDLGLKDAYTVSAGPLGTTGYLFETPQRRVIDDYWELIWNDQLVEAMDYARENGMDELQEAIGRWLTLCPGRPTYFTHWEEAFKYAASLFGLPIGDYPQSRPPQGKLPEEAKTQIRAAYRRSGLIAD
jgi:4-hydroxy-tetrahydrodipicolinate synthase